MEWKSICFKSVLEPSLFVNFLNYPHLSSSTAWRQQRTVVIIKSAVVVDTMMQQPDPFSLVKDLFPSCWKTAADSVQLSALFGIALADESHSAWGHTYPFPGQSRSNAWCMQEYKGLAGPLPQFWRAISASNLPIGSVEVFIETESKSNFSLCSILLPLFLSFPSTGGNPKRTS